MAAVILRIGNSDDLSVVIDVVSDASLSAGQRSEVHHTLPL